MAWKSTTRGTGQFARQIYSALASGGALSSKRPRSWSPATLNVRSAQPSPRAFALSSKGHVRLALLAPSGLVLASNWPKCHWRQPTGSRPSLGIDKGRRGP